MASDQKFSDWYFAFSKAHNRTPSQEEVWNAALTSPVAPEQVVAALVCENCGLPSNEWASHPCTTTSAPESAATPAAPSAVTDDRAYRKAWAKYAAKQHSWLNNSFPPMRDGRFDCAEHESEFQIFLAGVRHGRS